jgi:hypothetical protein
VAISVSAVANRSALHPDYYSEKKITVTPLNFVCKRRRPARLRDAREARRLGFTAPTISSTHIGASHFAIQRNADELRLFAAHNFRVVLKRTRCAAAGLRNFA